MVAYWIAKTTILDMKGLQPYINQGIKLVGTHPHETLVRNTRVVELEDARHYEQYYMHRFPSLEAALAMYNSPEYQAVIPYRKAACTATEIVLLEAGDGYKKP